MQAQTLIAKPKHSRLFYKLFYPSSHLNYPKLPDGYKDMIIVYTGIHLGFWDRIRILFSFTIELKNFIATEQICGKNTSLQCSVIVYKDTKRFKFGEEQMQKDLPTCNG